MTEVDWELLADHLGGALEGTPEATRVAHLVATDPAWRRAAARLSAALDAVAADLATDPAPGPMPAQVEARLTGALAAAAPPPGRSATAPDRPARGRSPLAGERGGGSGPRGGKPSGQRSRPPRRGRRIAWAGAGALLAGVAAFAVTLGPLRPAGDDVAGALSQETTTTAPHAADVPAPDDAAAQRLEEAEERPLIGPLEPAPWVASGTDYRRGTVAAPPEVAIYAPEGPTTFDGEQVADGVPAALARVWQDPADCLAAVTADVPAGGVTADLLDFAHFEGEPAVVIWLTAGDGTRWVHVAGPACGDEGADPDRRYQQRIG